MPNTNPLEQIRQSMQDNLAAIGGAVIGVAHPKVYRWLEDFEKRLKHPQRSANRKERRARA